MIIEQDAIRPLATVKAPFAKSLTMPSSTMN
jgi:hypothetical protein